MRVGEIWESINDDGSGYFKWHKVRIIDIDSDWVHMDLEDYEFTDRMSFISQNKVLHVWEDGRYGDGFKGYAKEWFLRNYKKYYPPLPKVEGKTNRLEILD